MNEIALFDTRVDPSVLAARLSDERAPDIVEKLNDEAPEVAAAILLGLPVEKVRAIWTRGPGSYGRNDAGDAAMDAAVLSKAVGKPVRVQYMRNEGTGWDPKAPASVHKGRAALDAQGKVVRASNVGSWTVSRPRCSTRRSA